MTLKERIISEIGVNKDFSKEFIKELCKTANYKEFKDKLISEKDIKEEEILLLFSKEFRMPFLDIQRYKIPQTNSVLLPMEIAYKYLVLPIYKIGEVLTIATSNPLDIIAYDDIKLVTGIKKIDIVLSREKDIEKTLKFLYKSREENISLDNLSSQTDILPEMGDMEDSLENMISESKNPPIVRAIDAIIYNALNKGASDIHIIPDEDGLDVKYRIDGVLIQEFHFPKKVQMAVFARLKIISSLDITENRIPQDGRFKVRYQEREVDFRVSSLPIKFGEKFVLRVLDKKRLSVGMKQLGFSSEPLKIFERAVASPFGMILVTGPTGSGKSTTLYSIIAQLNRSDKNIITIEDPIEYNIDGLTQVHVNPDIGLTFAEVLRAVLRQSPDIVMVGEIRDFETADIAIKASLTGELLFSTLHTNSAAGAFVRLIDMGAEPFLLASSLVATTAQRLARMLCPKCKEKVIVEKEVLRKFGFPDDKTEFFKAKGCKHCGGSGYKGRVALIEIILLDDTIKQMVVENKSEQEIEQYAKEKKGFQNLRMDGYLKCLEGITAIEEVIRVTTE
ncbi:MAG: GspE/PulE family protein [Candidatus Omnitrophota bacterium]